MFFTVGANQEEGEEIFCFKVLRLDLLSLISMHNQRMTWFSEFMQAAVQTYLIVQQFTM